MKFGILADIHANFVALSEVLKDIASHNIVKFSF